MFNLTNNKRNSHKSEVDSQQNTSKQTLTAH
jgi:hypothetical protein